MAPAASMASRIAHAAVCRQIVDDDDIPWRQRGYQHLFDVGAEGISAHWSVQHHGCGHAAEARAPVKVVVFQCPCGMGARQRCPRLARPRRRASLVEAPLIAFGAQPSMKTRCVGSRSGWVSNQASRRAATSGRSRSQACAVFFDGHGVAVEDAPDRARRKACAVLQEASTYPADFAGISCKSRIIGRRDIWDVAAKAKNAAKINIKYSNRLSRLLK